MFSSPLFTVPLSPLGCHIFSAKSCDMLYLYVFCSSCSGTKLGHNTRVILVRRAGVEARSGREWAIVQRGVSIGFEAERLVCEKSRRGERVSLQLLTGA